MYRLPIHSMAGENDGGRLQSVSRRNYISAVSSTHSVLSSRYKQRSSVPPTPCHSKGASYGWERRLESEELRSAIGIALLNQNLLCQRPMMSLAYAAHRGGLKSGPPHPAMCGNSFIISHPRHHRGRLTLEGPKPIWIRPMPKQRRR